MVQSETLSLEEGDRLLFCSDGLTSMVNDEDIRRIVTAGDDSEATVWNLIEAANSAGGVDNITVAVVDARA
jgi:protein phosphatase